MLYKKSLFLIVTLSVLIAGCERDSIEKKLIEDISIAKWYNNSGYAISMIWDDADTSHYQELAPLIDSFSFHTTFAVNTMNAKRNNLFGSYKELALRGHEIASHSVNHLDFSVLDEATIQWELLESKNDIFKYTEVIPTTFVHPFNRISEEYDHLTYEYYLFSRLVDEGRDSNAIIYGISSETTVDILKSKSQEARLDSSLIIFAGHRIDSSGWEPIPRIELKRYLQFVEEEANSWFTTYQNIAIYCRIRNKLSVSVEHGEIRIDDSKIEYNDYISFNISVIPVTIVIYSEEDLIFKGENILEVNFVNNMNMVSVNLLEGSSFEVFNSQRLR